MKAKNNNIAYKNPTDSERALHTKQNIEEKGKHKRPVMERIKTFEDACEELNIDSERVQFLWKEAGILNSDVIALLKLRIITTALNEGWEPQFTKNERRWYPLLRLYNHDEMLEMSDEWKQKHTSIYDRDCYKGEYDGLSTTYTSNSPSIASSSFAPHLCYRNTALADYSGKQFIDLWADFYLIRK